MGREPKTRMVRAGRRTYFFDLRETQTGKKFLVMTESRWKGDGQEHQRSSIILFPDQAQEFGDAVAEMAAKLA